MDDGVGRMEMSDVGVCRNGRWSEFKGVHSGQRSSLKKVSKTIDFNTLPMKGNQTNNLCQLLFLLNANKF